MDRYSQLILMFVWKNCKYIHVFILSEGHDIIAEQGIDKKYKKILKNLSISVGKLDKMWYYNI